GEAHDADGDEEGVLAADAVAEAAEEGRAERPHEEAGGEGQQREDHARGRVDAAEELLGDDGRERPVEVEVVPLEDGAQARGEDDLLVACGELALGRAMCCCSAHMFVSLPQKLYLMEVCRRLRSPSRSSSRERWP